jgi:hypothetical protein
VTVTVVDNGISLYPQDVLSVNSATGRPVGIKLSGGANLVSIMAVDPDVVTAAASDAAGGSAPANLTYGLFDLTIQVEAAGDTADVVFFLPEPAGENQVWYNAGGEWTVFGDQAVFNETRDQVTVSLRDGGPFDDDNSANGTIRSVSGLGDKKTEPETQDGGGGGCFIFTVR